MTLWNVIVLLFLAIPPSSKSSGWEKVYETPTPDRWIFAVWLARDGSWRAASNHVILTGDEPGSVSRTELGDDDVYVFGEDRSGAVMAAGSRQSIWEEDSHGFRRVHQRSGAPTTGREAHHDIIDRLGYYDPDHPDRLYALASLAVALWRGPVERGRSPKTIAPRSGPWTGRTPVFPKAVTSLRGLGSIERMAFSNATTVGRIYTVARQWSLP